MNGMSLERLHAMADRVRARPWLLWTLVALPPLLLMALFIVTGVRGVDLGYHWDEVDWQIRPVRDMVASGIVMPRAAIYPTLCKWLTLLPALPAGLLAILRGKDPRGVQAAIVAVLDRPNYLLTVRSMYVVVSAFAIPIVYGTVLVFRRKWWEAFIAAACVGLSWEYAYHSRWVATDCILVVFSALVLFMLALHHRTGVRGWLYAAAVAAGLGTGTKYQGVFLLVPVLLAGIMAMPRHRLGPRLILAHVGRAAALCGVAFAIYLVTTPATVLDPFTFVEQYHWISRQYLNGHGGHAVKTHAEHWKIVLEYFAVAYFTPYHVLTLVVFAVMLFGAVLWARTDRWMATLLFGFPIVYLLFFCFRFKDVIPRNYLLIVPFLALLVARGFAGLFELLPYRWARWLLAAGLVALMVVNATWLVRGGESIRHLDNNRYAREAMAYVAKHPKTRFRVSERIKTMATKQQIAIPPNVTTGTDFDEVVLFHRADGPDAWDWKCNDPWLIRTAFGPKEVNIVWYAGWQGHDRIVVMTRKKALSTGVQLAK